MLEWIKNRFLWCWCAVESFFVLLLCLFPRYSAVSYGAFFWGGVILLYWIFGGGIGCFHLRTMESFGRKEKIIASAVALGVILLCVLPMGLSPIWNGEIPDHRNQYEEMAEALLDGRLYLDHEVDPRLLAMENPYDTQMRRELEVEAEWDHAFYNGKYYMYFGVVPVVLLFLPYRALTGTALVTYHATQVFTAGFIAGFFALLYVVAKRFFHRMTLGMYLSLAAAFSVMSVWYASACPALYCTAITSALCMMVWSLYFYMKAVWHTEGENRQLRTAALGALFGALAFGCRPPVALANLLVIPILWDFLRQRQWRCKLTGKLALAAAPYVIVAALLMAYNAARFDNPFEFGQTYQMTITDQQNIGMLNDAAALIKRMIIELGNMFLFPKFWKTSFPYVRHAGILIIFPILLGIFGVIRPGVRRRLTQKGLASLSAFVVLTVAVICVMDVFWSPVITERYKMDILFLMGLLCFLVIGAGQELWQAPGQALRCSRCVSYLALMTVFTCFLLFLVPHDQNAAEEVAQLLPGVRRVMFFGLGE